ARIHIRLPPATSCFNARETQEIAVISGCVPRIRQRCRTTFMAITIRQRFGSFEVLSICIIAATTKAKMEILVHNE
ncbi:MAG: hypothetical protein DMG15_24035, partial [Acidobacteria bacterium]